MKKRKLVVLRSLNSPEYIANQFTRYAFNESSLFDALTVLEGLTVQDLQEVAGLLLSEEKMSICQVLPKNKIKDTLILSLKNCKMRVLFSCVKIELVEIREGIYEKVCVSNWRERRDWLCYFETINSRWIYSLCSLQ